VHTFKIVGIDMPDEGQEVIVYKLKLIQGIAIKTPANFGRALYVDGKFLCDFQPTHWVSMPGIK